MAALGNHPSFASSADEIVEYHPLSSLAIAGLVLGLGSVTALLSVALWIVPAAGIIVSAAALWRIGRPQSALTGRGAAVAGLTLALVFAAAAPTDWFVYQRLIRGQARRLAEQWFDALARNQPREAHQLTLMPKQRAPAAESLENFYRTAGPRAGELQTYLSQPVVRTLLALGPKARVRYYESVDQGHEDNHDWADLIFAVTFKEEEGPKTFFVEVLVDRDETEPEGADWRLIRVNGGVRPAGW